MDCLPYECALAVVALSLAACGSVTTIEDAPRQSDASSASASSSAAGSGGGAGAVGSATSVASTAGSTGISGAGMGGAGGGGGEGGSSSSVAASSASGGAGGEGAGGEGAGGEGGGAVDPWAGPVKDLAELDLGVLPVGVQHTFPIPDRTLGFTVLATAASPDEGIGVYRLRPPVGGSVIFDFAMTGKKMQVFGNTGWIAAANPQSDSADAMPVKPGNWRLTLGGEPGVESAHVMVYVRRTEDGAFHGGVMDVNVFRASGVSSDAHVAKVLGAMFASYAGIGLGNVKYAEISKDFAYIDSKEEYRKMLVAYAANYPVPALNLFVVGGFANAAFGAAIGVAGGVPGSPMRQNTGLSGVAYKPSKDPAYDATVLMHEVGHLGGLFHTTEIQVDETDPLSDTASCPAATIESKPDACPDKTNVMFPMAYGATVLSPAQQKVLQGSALHRGVLLAGGAPAPPMALFPPRAGEAAESGVPSGVLTLGGAPARPMALFLVGAGEAAEGGLQSGMLAAGAPAPPMSPFPLGAGEAAESGAGETPSFSPAPRAGDPATSPAVAALAGGGAAAAKGCGAHCGVSVDAGAGSTNQSQGMTWHPPRVGPADGSMPPPKDALGLVLGGLSCDRGGDYESLAVRLAGSTRAEAAKRLLAIALDAAEPELVRARAFGAYVRAIAEPPATGLSTALALAEKLARSSDAPADLRVRALEVLAARDAQRARRAADTALTSPDAALRDLAATLRALP